MVVPEIHHWNHYSCTNTKTNSKSAFRCTTRERVPAKKLLLFNLPTWQDPHRSLAVFYASGILIHLSCRQLKILVDLWCLHKSKFSGLFLSFMTPILGPISMIRITLIETDNEAFTLKDKSGDFMMQSYLKKCTSYRYVKRTEFDKFFENVRECCKITHNYWSLPHSLARQMEIYEAASGMIESKIIWKSQNLL